MRTVLLIIFRILACGVLCGLGLPILAIGSLAAAAVAAGSVLLVGAIAGVLLVLIVAVLVNDAGDEPASAILERLEKLRELAPSSLKKKPEAP